MYDIAVIGAGHAGIEAALAAAGLCGWERISCVDEQGAVRPPEDIHQQIWDRVSALL